MQLLRIAPSLFSIHRQMQQCSQQMATFLRMAIGINAKTLLGCNDRIICKSLPTLHCNRADLIPSFFAIDRWESHTISFISTSYLVSSGSMTYGDRLPLPRTPATPRIVKVANNRFGAVASSLYEFWTARAAANGSAAGLRRDAYTVIPFRSNATASVYSSVLL
jgi:hypothetical protein